MKKNKLAGIVLSGVMVLTVSGLCSAGTVQTEVAKLKSIVASLTKTNASLTKLNNTYKTQLLQAQKNIAILNSQVADYKKNYAKADKVSGFFLDNAVATFDNNSFPIKFKNEYYVPVSFLSKYFGKAATYDNSIQSLVIGSRDSKEMFNYITKTNMEKSLDPNMVGNEGKGFVGNTNANLEFNVDSKYQNVKLKIKRGKTSDWITLKIYNENGVVLKSLDLLSIEQDKFVDVDFNTSGAKSIKIEVVSEYPNMAPVSVAISDIVAH